MPYIPRAFSFLDFEMKQNVCQLASKLETLLVTGNDMIIQFTNEEKENSTSQSIWAIRMVHLMKQESKIKNVPIAQ